MSKKSLSTYVYVQKPVPANIWAMFVCSVWLPTFQHDFQLFCSQRCALYRIFPVFIESPHRHSVPVAALSLSHCSELNITKEFTCPHSQIFSGLKSGNNAGQLMGLLRHIMHEPLMLTLKKRHTYVPSGKSFNKKTMVHCTYWSYVSPYC